MSWTRLTSITANNGSNIITVNSGSTTNIKVGDALLVEGFDLVEIEGVFASQLQTKATWKAPTQSNVSAAVVPTFGDFNNAVEEIRKLRQVTTDNLDAMEKWWTQSNGTVTFQSYNGDTVEVRTAQEMDSSVKQIEQVAKDTITEVDTFGVVMTEAQAMAIREQNRRKFAASDFVYHGGHQDSSQYTPVNQGMFVRTNSTEHSNRLYIGDSGGEGDSKTPYAVFNATGITLPILGNYANQDQKQFVCLFPEAPNGTVTYDSATGVVTDFTTDVDPKYGDVAGTVNEAVSRAFEGDIRNGDFRNGVSNWSVRLLSATPVTNGIQLSSAQGGIYQDIAVTAGVAQKLKVVLSSTNESNTRALIYDGAAFTTTLDDTVFDVGTTPQVWETTVVPTQSTVRVYLFINTTTTVAVFNSAMLSVGTKEVVTKRVDMTALEFWPELITDDEVFPHCIQNQSTTFGDTGIPTVVSDRPESYFQVFEGQVGIQKGRCVKWSTLTSAQKHAVASYLGESFYNTADGLVQWRVRNRGFMGAGNGDWRQVNPVGNSAYGGESNRLMFGSAGPHKYVKPQGAENTPAPAIDGYPILDSREDWNGHEKGVFSAYSGSNVRSDNYGYKGESYMYIIATVPRSNQGVYHPSLNQLGTARVEESGYGVLTWYSSRLPARFITTQKDCFAKSYGAYTAPFGGRIAGGAAQSGHPDGLYYDAIYSSGVSGVVDHRLKYGAWDASSLEKASVIREELKSGTYRGREKPLFTQIHVGTAEGRVTSIGLYSPATPPDSPLRFDLVSYVGLVDLVRVGDSVSVVDSVSGEIMTGICYEIAASTARYHRTSDVKILENTSANSSADLYFVIGSSGGNFGTVEGVTSRTDIIGNPADILNTPALKEGWLGGWIPVIPDGTTKLFYATKPSYNNLTLTGVYTTNNGDSWTPHSAITWLAGSNAYSSGLVGGGVFVCNYTTLATATKPENSLAGRNGVGGLLNGVFITCDYRDLYGRALAYSTLGLILKSTAAAPRYQECIYTSVAILHTGELAIAATGMTTIHNPLSISPPDAGNTEGAKFLIRCFSDAERASLSIFSNELTYSSDWGDNDTLKVVGNSSFTDDNLLSNRGTLHSLKKPYGWIKNEI